MTLSSCALRPRPTPAIVPPVPAAQVKPSIRPSICSQISGAVLSMCALRLAMLSNWFAQTAPGGLLGDPARGVDEMAGVGERSAAPVTSSAPSARKRVHLLAGDCVLGHDDHGAIAERIGDQREPDAGIARGPLDDRAAGLEHAARLGIAHDPQRRAVLDRGAGVGEFALAPDFAARRRARPLEEDERGVADQVERAGKCRRRGCGHRLRK